MFRPIYSNDKEKEEWHKIINSPINRKLKYTALSFISVSIVLLIIILLWFETLSQKTYLIMRGCSGLFAIIFAIIVTIYLYRINTAFHNQKYRIYHENRDNEKD